MSNYLWAELVYVISIICHLWSQIYLEGRYMDPIEGGGIQGIFIQTVFNTLLVLWPWNVFLLLSRAIVRVGEDWIRIRHAANP